MKLKAKKGSNRFNWHGLPLPKLPTFKNSISGTIKIDDAWFEGVLTKPLQYGVKDIAIGAYDYHKGGANYGIIEKDGRIFIYPRYYDQEGKLHPSEKDRKLLEIHKGDVVYREIWIHDGWILFRYKVLNPSSKWMVWNVDVWINPNWLSPPYIGSKGNAVAKRDLGLEIKKA